MTLDYSLWRENDGTQDRWMWEVLDVDDDGNETVLAGGIEDTQEEARDKVKGEIRKRA